MKKMVLIFVVMAIITIGYSVQADLMDISQQAVQVLNQEHEADIKEMVKLKMPVIVARTRAEMQGRLVLKEGSKAVPDKKKVEEEQNKLNIYLEESKNLETPYMNKLNALTGVILSKISKNRRLQAEELNEAKMLVQVAIDYEVERTALEKVELAGIKNLAQKAVTLLKREHPAEIQELLKVKLSTFQRPFQV